MRPLQLGVLNALLDAGKSQDQVSDLFLVR